MTPLIRLLAGLTILVAIVGAEPAIGWMTAPGKISGAVPPPGTEVDLVAEVSVEPQRFHIEALGEYGFYGGRDGDPRRIRLTGVEASQVRNVAALLWVRRVEVQPG